MGKRLRRLGTWGAVGAVIAALIGQEWWQRVSQRVFELGHGTAEHQWSDGLASYRLLWDAVRQIEPTYGVALTVSVIAVPLVILARVFARSRVRANLPDPLDRARAWASRRKWLPLVPAVLWTAFLAFVRMAEASHYTNALAGVTSFIPGLAVAFGGVFALARGLLHGLTAPTLAPNEGEASTMTIRDEEIAFSAVAVTPETKAAVVAVAFAPQIITVLVGTLKLNAELAWLVLAYAAVVAGAVAAFSRASRVAVGIDGILVHGTSRRRFFPYREIGGARVRGSDLEILRGGKVILRLQLHGADAARADAVLARIQANVARVAERRGRAEEGLVETASADEIARAVAGAVDFRRPTLSRDALWDIVEGPSVDVEARAAAAKALAKTAQGEERARLRVAAARCADPRVRVALERVDAEVEDVAAEESDAQESARRGVVTARSR
jgi:hypothetical protein